MKSIYGQDPVFVDSTGRRHRTIRRAGAFLAIPAGGYVVLLVSSLLGGPTVNTPLVPLPAAPQRLSDPRPVVTPTPASDGESTTSPETVGPSEKTPTQDPTQLPTPTRVTPATTAPVTPVTTAPVTPVTTAPVMPGQPTTPTGIPTGTPTATPTGTSTGTPTPTSTPRHGKPTAPPGRTKKP